MKVCRLVVPVTLVVLSTMVACARTLPVGRLADAPESELAAIERAPSAAGERIYEGRVYASDSSRTTPLYWYDRRVQQVGATLHSTHITRDSTGTVVVTQSAIHDADYALRRANLLQRQSGISGAVEVNGNEARYTRTKSGKTEVRTETLDAPLLAGPTIFGFIVTHWDALQRFDVLRVRFAVLEMNRSISFDLRRVEDTNGSVTIRMTASSWALRRVVAPTYFYFDPASRAVTGYDGLVPPLERVGGRLRTFTARVRYTMAAAAFK